MLKSINHIGIAVKDLDAAVDTFRKLFQFDDVHRERVEEQKVAVASFKIGDVILELTAPTADDSPIAKFIAKRGEGIHHIAFESNNIESDLSRLKNEEIKLINESPKDGAHNMLVAFAHPKSTMGVLTEICAPQK